MRTTTSHVARISSHLFPFSIIQSALSIETCYYYDCLYTHVRVTDRAIKQAIPCGSEDSLIFCLAVYLPWRLYVFIQKRIVLSLCAGLNHIGA